MVLIMELKQIKIAINSFCEENNLNLRINGNLLDRYNRKGDRQQEVICKIELHNYPFWNHAIYDQKDKLIKFIRELKSSNKDCKYLRGLTLKFNY